MIGVVLIVAIVLGCAAAAALVKRDPKPVLVVTAWIALALVLTLVDR